MHYVPISVRPRDEKDGQPQAFRNSSVQRPKLAKPYLGLLIPPSQSEWPTKTTTVLKEMQYCTCIRPTKPNSGHQTISPNGLQSPEEFKKACNPGDSETFLHPWDSAMVLVTQIILTLNFVTKVDVDPGEHGGF